MLVGKERRHLFIDKISNFPREYDLIEEVSKGNESSVSETELDTILPEINIALDKKIDIIKMPAQKKAKLSSNVNQKSSIA